MVMAGRPQKYSPLWLPFGVGLGLMYPNATMYFGSANLFPYQLYNHFRPSVCGNIPKLACMMPGLSHPQYIPAAWLQTGRQSRGQFPICGRSLIFALPKLIWCTGNHPHRQG